MSDESPVTAELDRYLRALPPRLQGKLLCELERAGLAGAAEPAHALILDRLRAAVREEQSQAERAGTPQRLFYEPLEPFLVDGAGSRKHRGWIQRSSLNAMWRWLGQQEGFEDLGDLEAAAAAALLDGAYVEARRIATGLRRRAEPAMVAALQTAAPGTRARLRLSGQLGGEAALADMADIADVFRLEDRLSALGAELPEMRDHPSADQVKQLFAHHGFAGDDLLYPLILIYSQLANPVELLQLLASAAGTDDGEILRSHQLSPCVGIVLADLDFTIERMARLITRPDEFDSLVAAIRRFHCLASGMGVTIDLDGAEEWRAALAERRRRASEILGGELSRAPGAIRRALKPNPEGAAAGPAPADIAEAEYAARLMVALRPYRSEVAVNELLTGVVRRVEAFIEAANAGILNDLRTAEGASKEAARAAFAAALSINRIVFGEEYTALLRRSGRLADPPREPEGEGADATQPAA